MKQILFVESAKQRTCYYQANDVVDHIATNDDYYQNETNNVLEPIMGVFCGIAIFFFISFMCPPMFHSLQKRDTNIVIWLDGNISDTNDSHSHCSRKLK